MRLIEQRRRERETVRAFRNRKTDYRKHVKAFYLANGLAYISCNVKDYNDVIDSYSVKGYEWPNADFVRYIEDNATYIPIEYPIVLDICGGGFSDKQKETIEHSLREYYKLKLGEMQDDLTATRKKSWFLLIWGLILLGILIAGLYFALPAMVREVLMIGLWFCLWEGLNVVLFERRETVAQKSYIAQMERMVINFSEVFVDEPMDTKEADKIVEELISV